MSNPSTLPDTLSQFEAAIDSLALWVAGLRTETRNAAAGPFRDLSTEERLAEHGGCSVLVAAPFAVLVVDARGWPIARAVPVEGGGSRLAMAGTPAAYSAGSLDRLRTWAGVAADRLSTAEHGTPGAKVAVWTVDAVRVFDRRIAEARRLIPVE